MSDTKMTSTTHRALALPYLSIARLQLGARRRVRRRLAMQRNARGGHARRADQRIDKWRDHSVRVETFDARLEGESNRLARGSALRAVDIASNWGGDNGVGIAHAARLRALQQLQLIHHRIPLCATQGTCRKRSRVAFRKL